MKIAFSSSGAMGTSAIGGRFGQDRYIVIYDTKQRTFESYEPASLPVYGTFDVSPEERLAEFLAQKACRAVFAGRCCECAFDNLRTRGITVYSGLTGSVKGILQKYLTRKLKASTAADKESAS
jgi:predicted Fe-Mo cluster-binding NifX family protein